MAGLEYVCRPRLIWPPEVKRTPASDRSGSRGFRSGGSPITTPRAEARLIEVLDAFTKVGQDYRTTGIEIAADWSIGKLGGFLADGHRGQSGDPGVVLSFVFDGMPMTLPCDRYDSVAGNLAAIAAHLEAIRGIERWGVSTVKQLLSAHAALPATAGEGTRPWRAVLELGPSSSIDDVKTAFRRLALVRHPDRGGSDAAMTELNLAQEEALKELGA